MGTGMLPPPQTLTIWTWETVVFLALLFFGAFAFAFFREGMAVLYHNHVIKKIIELVRVSACEEEGIRLVEHKAVKGLPRLFE